MSLPVSEFLDTDLVALAKQGDPEAFAELVRRTRTGCSRAARAILKDEFEAEDHVQNALLKAWRQLPAFREDAAFSTWIKRIVVNECLMTLRARRKAPLVWLDDTEAAARSNASDLRDHKRNAEQEYAAAQVSALLHAEMRRVPASFRDILYLSEVRRMPLAEAAGKLGITAAAAKTRLHRARRALRKRLEPHAGRMGLATLTA